jgi:hypothetical protein
MLAYTFDLHGKPSTLLIRGSDPASEIAEGEGGLLIHGSPKM